MDLSSADFFEKCLEYLENMDNVGIAGVAGRIRGSSGLDTNIMHGIPPRVVPGERLDMPKPVHTLDECLLIIPKLRFKETQFDPVTCDNWHLYGVDYCLTMQNKGFDVVVLPLFAIHLSEGASMNTAYFDSLGKVIKKHKNETDSIATTVRDWSTLQPVWYQKMMFLIWNDLYFFYKRTKTSLNDQILKFYLQKYVDKRDGIYLSLPITGKEINDIQIGHGKFNYSKNWDSYSSSPVFQVTGHVSPDQLVQTCDSIIGDRSLQGSELNFIFASHVIESQKDVPGFLDCCKRNLGGKGILVLTCTHKENIPVGKDRTDGNYTYFNAYSSEELIRLIDTRNIKILAVTTRYPNDVSLICQKSPNHNVNNTKYFHKYAFWRLISNFRVDQTWKKG